MTLPRPLVRTLVLCVTLIAAGLSAQPDATSPTIVLNPGIPQDAERYTFTLTAAQAGQGGVQNFANTTPLPPDLQEDYNEHYRYYRRVGLGPDGRTYEILLGEVENASAAPGLEFLNDSPQSNTTQRVLILTSHDAHPHERDVVKEGLLAQGHQGRIPIPVTLERPLGSNALTKAESSLLFMVNGSNDSQLHFGASFSPPVRLAGQQLIGDSILRVSIENLFPGAPLPTQQTFVSLESAEGRSLFNVGGSLNTPLALLPNTRAAFESITEDASQITLAVLSGSLREAANSVPRPGEPVPPFAHVELFDRRLMTREDLLKSAEGGAVVLVFGNLQTVSFQPHFGPSGPQSSPLPMNETVVTNLITRSLGNDAQPLVVFVVDSLDLAKLYQDHLNTRPPFLVLANPTDPMQVQFTQQRPNQPYFSGPHYPNPASGQTLRDRFRLPNTGLAVVVIGPDGKLLFRRAAAELDFQDALYDAAESILMGGATPAE